MSQNVFRGLVVDVEVQPAVGELVEVLQRPKRRKELEGGDLGLSRVESEVLVVERAMSPAIWPRTAGVEHVPDSPRSLCVGEEDAAREGG